MLISSVKLFTRLRNWVARRSLTELIQRGMNSRMIKYDPKIGEKFYGTGMSDLGFVLYSRFSDFRHKEINLDLVKDISIFMDSHIRFFEESKNSIPNQKERFLDFAYVSYITWRYIVNEAIDAMEKEELKETETVGRQYLQVHWQDTGPKHETIYMIKTRIRPTTKLMWIAYFDIDDIYEIEKELKSYNYNVNIKHRKKRKCMDKDIGNLIHTLFSNT